MVLFALVMEAISPVVRLLLGIEFPAMGTSSFLDASYNPEEGSKSLIFWMEVGKSFLFVVSGATVAPAHRTVVVAKVLTATYAVFAVVMYFTIFLGLFSIQSSLDSQFMWMFVKFGVSSVGGTIVGLSGALAGWFSTSSDVSDREQNQ
jgi:hypothetical protein